MSRRETQTNGVSGVKAWGTWTWRNNDLTGGDCIIGGDITDTVADGHAVGVQWRRSRGHPGNDNGYGSPDAINTGGRGSTTHFSHEFDDVTNNEHVWIREVVSEQGDVIRAGDWEHTCGHL